MCWSATVSWRFAWLDTLLVALLLWRAARKPQTTLAGTYAALMTSVALQEWGQYWLWRRELSCEAAMDVALGVFTTAAAESVPLSLLFCSWRTVGNVPHFQRIRWVATGLWLLQFVAVAGSALVTDHYCVVEGPKGHQVWLCESATYAAGGHALHYSFYWIYVIACLLAAESVDMSRGERRRLQGIALVSAVVCLAWYGNTLEACSVWCWTAFTVGINLVAEVYGVNVWFLTKWRALLERFRLRATQKLSRSMHTRNGPSPRQRQLSKYGSGISNNL